MSDMPDIPDFLIVTAEEAERRRQWWKNHPPRRRADERKRKQARFDLPKTMTPEAWAILRQVEKERAQRQAERLAALKEKHRCRAAVRRQSRGAAR
jgi:hypothetical protein